jgi:hypothetical protein
MTIDDCPPFVDRHGRFGPFVAIEQERELHRSDLRGGRIG